MSHHKSYEADTRGWPGDDVVVPPHNLDLDEIVQIGRAQLRRRRLAAVGAGTAVLLAIAAIPAIVPGWLARGGQPAGSGPLPVLGCQVAELTLPEPADGDDSIRTRDPHVQVQASDPTGRYVIGNDLESATRELTPAGTVRTVPRDDPTRMILWRDGVPAVIPNLRGDALAVAVNPAGVVVGEGSDEDAVSYAWVYRDGNVQELPRPTGYEQVDATAINAAGDVVGTALHNDGRYAVVVWPAHDLHTPRVLAGPAGTSVLAVAITDNGTIIGQVVTDTDGLLWYASAYAWGPEGTGRSLPLPAGTTEVTVSGAQGRWAVGVALRPGPEATVSPAVSPPASPPPASAKGGAVPVRWDLATGTVEVLEVDQFSDGSGLTLDSAGNVLMTTAPTTVVRDGKAFALPDPVATGVVALPDQVEDVSTQAASISEDGTLVVGWIGFSEPDGIVPVMWRC